MAPMNLVRPVRSVAVSPPPVFVLSPRVAVIAIAEAGTAEVVEEESLGPIPRRVERYEAENGGKAGEGTRDGFAIANEREEAGTRRREATGGGTRAHRLGPGLQPNIQ